MCISLSVSLEFVLFYQHQLTAARLLYVGISRRQRNLVALFLAQWLYYQERQKPGEHCQQLLIDNKIGCNLSEKDATNFPRRQLLDFPLGFNNLLRKDFEFHF